MTVPLELVQAGNVARVHLRATRRRHRGLVALLLALLLLLLTVILIKTLRTPLPLTLRLRLLGSPLQQHLRHHLLATGEVLAERVEVDRLVVRVGEDAGEGRDVGGVVGLGEGEAQVRVAARALGGGESRGGGLGDGDGGVGRR